MDTLFEAFKSFAEAADMGTVVSIAILTYLIQITLFTRLGWDHAIVWVPFVLSFLLTPIMSTAEQTAWGGQFYYRAVVYNGGVGLFAWHVVLPQLRKRYPEWFEMKETEEEEAPPSLPPAA